MQGAYAAGTVQVMELSEIIEAIPDLTKDEIDHLRSSLQDYGLINVRESILVILMLFLGMTPYNMIHMILLFYKLECSLNQR